MKEEDKNIEGSILRLLLIVTVIAITWGEVEFSKKIAPPRVALLLINMT